MATDETYPSTARGAILGFVHRSGKKSADIAEVLPGRNAQAVYVLFKDDTYMVVDSPEIDLRAYLAYPWDAEDGQKYPTDPE